MKFTLTLLKENGKPSLRFVNKDKELLRKQGEQHGQFILTNINGDVVAESRELSNSESLDMLVDGIIDNKTDTFKNIIPSFLLKQAV